MQIISDFVSIGTYICSCDVLSQVSLVRLKSTAQCKRATYLPLFAKASQFFCHLRGRHFRESPEFMPLLQEIRPQFLRKCPEQLTRLRQHSASHRSLQQSFLMQPLGDLKNLAD